MSSLESRMSSLETSMANLEQTVLRLDQKVDALQDDVNYLKGRMDALEVRVDSIEEKSEARHQELLRRFNILDADLKKFASVTNEAILHYAGEMDTVRDRLNIIETKLGIPYHSD